MPQDSMHINTGLVLRLTPQKELLFSISAMIMETVIGSAFVIATIVYMFKKKELERDNYENFEMMRTAKEVVEIQLL